jgi:hypothetical protein
VFLAIFVFNCFVFQNTLPNAQQHCPNTLCCFGNRKPVSKTATKQAQASGYNEERRYYFFLIIKFYKNIFHKNISHKNILRYFIYEYFYIGIRLLCGIKKYLPNHFSISPDSGDQIDRIPATWPESGQNGRIPAGWPDLAIKFKPERSDSGLLAGFQRF